MTTTAAWVHIKTGKRYWVLGTALDANNMDPKNDEQVVYKALTGEHAGEWYVRSQSEFMDKFQFQVDDLA